MTGGGVTLTFLVSHPFTCGTRDLKTTTGAHPLVPPLPAAAAAAADDGCRTTGVPPSPEDVPSGNSRCSENEERGSSAREERSARTTAAGSQEESRLCAERAWNERNKVTDHFSSKHRRSARWLQMMWKIMCASDRGSLK